MPVFNQSRSNIIRLIFGGMFLVIFAQLFNLQVFSDKYKKMAQENALFPKEFILHAVSFMTIVSVPFSTIPFCTT